MKNVCVLVSGGGSNLQSLIDHVQNGTLAVNLCGVIASRAGVYALERAKQNGIPSQVIARKDFPTKEAYDAAMLQAIEQTGAEYLVLAGFLSILGESVIHRYANRILNIHPALLPSFGGKGYYGLKVHQAALDYGVKVTGATVHFVDEGTDTGPIVWQESLMIDPQDTAESLQQRVMEIEHRILPRAVSLLVQGRLRVDGRRVSIEEEER